MAALLGRGGRHDRPRGRRNAGDAGVEVTSAGASGKPGEALVTEAERLGATMIVVGNRRVQGIARVLGSVAAAVAHHAPCDVYIAKTV